MERIIPKKLSNGEYYKRKAIVDKVIDKYEAEVEVLESSRKAKDGGDILRIDQEDLETVIPKELGEKVRIVNGRYRGKKARVERLDKKNYRAELRLVDDDRVVELDYEDLSKMA
jgi:DNA/RNA-binding protein KIN17